MVVDLIIKNDQVEGVITSLGVKIFSKTVVLTNGTFLNGLIHIGEKEFQWRARRRKSVIWPHKMFGKYRFYFWKNEDWNTSSR